MNAPNSKATNPEAPNSTRMSCDFCQVLREILRETVPALIALAILVVALSMLWDVHHLVDNKPEPETYQRKKDVLLLALGFLGTVTGYYFGRAPAERHADTARDAAKAAQEREQKVRREAHEGLDHIQQQHSGEAEADAVNTAINQLRSRLWTM